MIETTVTLLPRAIEINVVWCNLCDDSIILSDTLGRMNCWPAWSNWKKLNRGFYWKRSLREWTHDKRQSWLLSVLHLHKTQEVTDSGRAACETTIWSEVLGTKAEQGCHNTVNSGERGWQCDVGEDDEWEKSRTRKTSEIWCGLHRGGTVSKPSRSSIRNKIGDVFSLWELRASLREDTCKLKEVTLKRFFLLSGYSLQCLSYCLYQWSTSKKAATESWELIWQRMARNGFLRQSAWWTLQVGTEGLVHVLRKTISWLRYSSPEW